ncbi:MULTISPECIES: type II secretion system protein [Chromobacterium]|uniref:Type II secretion system protein n=1 Tax=Chromobacterium aquaticum TaxID=467180 RepID=A0ABV8ZQS9_9NEIS|nr:MULTISPECIES: type II secretion system protein [Chromobacterium]KMN32138.1 general secretion pathway protein GspG [Chromobacterium sp. LK1]MCD5363080.1 type II secretion system GspH family protein [Chromobacterium aquaticum]
MKSQSGFTLIELMAALTLLALLLSASLPLADLARRRAQESELRHSLRQIRDAIDAYRQAVTDKKITVSPEQSGYPPSLASLVEGVVDSSDPNGGKLYFLRRLPADPMCERCEGQNPAESWDTRSYDSSVEAFSAGRDVYDIRSKSGGKGINGIPYQQW